MNRREFTASITAFAASSALPIGAKMPVVAAPAVTLPSGSYAWAQLIARAQNKCSPATLVRHLRLDPNAAAQLFDMMVRDGVLRAPSTAGIARASHPIDPSGKQTQVVLSKLRTRVHDTLSHTQSQADESPLVKAYDPALVCEDSTPEDDQDACTDQSLQERPQAG